MFLCRLCRLDLFSFFKAVTTEKRLQDQPYWCPWKEWIDWLLAGKPSGRQVEGQPCMSTIWGWEMAKYIKISMMQSLYNSALLLPVSLSEGEAGQRHGQCHRSWKQPGDHPVLRRPGGSEDQGWANRTKASKNPREAKSVACRCR